MRILFVSDHEFLPHRVGGRESSIDELANHLARRGHEVQVLAAARNRNTPGPLGSIHWPVFYSIERVSEVMAAAERHLAARRFDVAVYSVSDFASFVSSSSAIRRRQILYVRDANEVDEWTPDTFPAGQTLFANSEFIAGRIRERTGLVPQVFSPVVDFSKYRVESAGNAVTFINPVHQKGVDLAFALAENHPDIPFKFGLCWGMDMREINSLRRRAAPLGNLDVVDASLDVRDLYSDTRILLVPSQWNEGFGRVVLEAQCSGIPVIAKNRGGLAEAMGDGGWLIPAEADTDAWADAISMLWTDRRSWENISARARERAARFEMDTEAKLQRFEVSLASLSRPEIVSTRPIAKCAVILLPSEDSPAAALQSLSQQNCEHLEIFALQLPGQDILASSGVDAGLLTITPFDPDAGLTQQVFSLLHKVECGFVTLARASDRFDTDFVYTLLCTHLNALWTAAAAVCDVGVTNDQGNIVIPGTSGFRAQALEKNELAILENHRDTFGFSANALPWETARFSPLPSGTMFRRDALMLLQGAPSFETPVEFLRFLQFGAHLIGGTLYTDRVLCWSIAQGDALTGVIASPGRDDMPEDIREAAIAAMLANGAERHLKPENVARTLSGHFSRKRVLAICEQSPVLRDILIKSFLDGLLSQPVAIP